MSVRTKNLINKTFANSSDASVFFSERNSFGKTFQFLYQLETEPDNLYYIDETVDNPILLTDGAVYSVNDKTGVVVLSTSDISEATNKKYVTDAQLTIIGNTSGTNTGDNAINSQYSGLVSNATHTGEVTGATALIVDKTAITNKTTETIVGTDYVLFGDSSDSNNLKKGLVSDIVALSGGGSLSSLTAATATNIINNGNFKQEWQWNSLSSNTGLKLSSTSGGLLNTQNRLFECELTGAMPNTGNSSYAGYFRNTQTVGAPYGLYAEGNGAIYAKGAINIDNGRLYLGGGLGASFYRNFGNTYLQSATGEDLILVSQGSRLINSVSGCAWGLTINKKSATEYVMGIGGVDCVSSNYRAEFTTATFIERSSDKLLFSTNSGLAGGYSTFSPTYQMSIVGSTSNVGIGTTSPVTSAALDITSTTKGFLPPRMTATQASAISSPAKGLILYSTDTNGTFTSAGLWMYNGTIWKLILAE